MKEQDQNNYTGTLPQPPDEISASKILVRLVDGMAFRYYWATEGLTEEDFRFQPCEGSFTIGELMNHIWKLINWVNSLFAGTEMAQPPKESLPVLRSESLELLAELRKKVDAMSNEDLDRIQIAGMKDTTFPFWNLINGPLADMLTHVGQLNSWRRMNGNPPLKANPFSGQPPQD